MENNIIEVPVASDNTFFSPVLIAGSNYTIGAKCEEDHIKDYFEALNKLSAMDVARWRRPNYKNRRGIVTAVDWIKVNKDVLLNIKSFNLADLMAANEAYLNTLVKGTFSDNPANRELLKDIEEIKQNSNINETTKTLLIEARIGQGKYREELIRIWGKCSVTGCPRINILIASHIKPWKDSDNNERLDGYNGLLLTPNLDKLFDLGLISFDNNGKIIVSSNLSNDDTEMLNVNHSMSLTLVHDNNRKYLDYHRNKVFIK